MSLANSQAVTVENVLYCAIEACVARYSRHYHSLMLLP